MPGSEWRSPGRRQCKRTRAQILRDRERVARWRFEGLTLAEVVERLAVLTQRDGYVLSQTEVWRDIRAVEAEWKAGAVIAREYHLHRLLARLDAEYAACWEHFRKSMEPRTTTRARRREVLGAATAKDGTGEKQEVPVTGHTEVGRETVERLGDPRWFERMAAINERYTKLLGLDAPPRTAESEAADPYAVAAKIPPKIMPYQEAAEITLSFMNGGDGRRRDEPDA
jgi:hypothetical protein